MDAQIRHRLIGVGLLLLLAALIMPIVFRSPEQVRLALEMELPEPPEIASLTLAPVVTEDEVEAALESIVESREDIAQAAAAREASAGEGTGVQVVDIPTGWALQIAALSSADAANALVQRLRDADYSAYVRGPESDNNELYRIFVGPELERKRVEHVREQLVQDMRFKMEGIVVPYSL